MVSFPDSPGCTFSCPQREALPLPQIRRDLPGTGMGMPPLPHIRRDLPGTGMGMATPREWPEFNLVEIQPQRIGIINDCLSTVKNTAATAAIVLIGVGCLFLIQAKKTVAYFFPRQSTPENTPAED